MDTLRLLLRSVYLKGQVDAHKKTSDMSWEDEIVDKITHLNAEKAEPTPKSDEQIQMDYYDLLNREEKAEQPKYCQCDLCKKVERLMAEKAERRV